MVFLSAQLIPDRIVNPDGAGQFGGKIHALRDLLSLGFPVPELFAISTEQSRWLASLSQEERENILRGEVFNIHEALGAQLYAVRSASLSEDGSESSLAGCFHSSVAIPPERLSLGIEEVLFHPKNQEAVQKGRFSIFVQKFCEAEYSGVCFTRDPAGLRHMVLEVVLGACSRLVSGESTPERFTAFHGGPYPQILGNAADTLWQTMEQIEHQFEFPQDVEWCFAEQRFWILQSRPISTISPARARGLIEVDRDPRLKGKLVLFRRTGVSEIAPRPSPLTLSLLERIYSRRGPVDLAYERFGIRYEERPQLEIFLGELFVNREEELKTLFPAAHLKSDGREGFSLTSIVKIFRTWINSRRFRNIRLRDLSQEVSRLDEAIQRRLFSLQDDTVSFGRIVDEFCKDYQEVFRINLAAEASRKRLEAALKVTAGELLIHLPELFSVGELGALSRSPERVGCAKDILGNSLEFLDPSVLSVHSKRLSKKLSEIAAFVALPTWKQSYLRPQILEAANLSDLRELGRVLAVLSKDRIRGVLSRMLAESKIADTSEELIPFFTLSEFSPSDSEVSVSSYEKARTRLEEWKHRPPVDLPSVLCNFPYRRSEFTSFGVSSGKGRGILRTERELSETCSEEKSVLFVSSLSPELLKYFPNVSGIVASQGGLLSHLAILARERELPVIIVPESSKVLGLLGKEVEIDGSEGGIRAL